MQLINSYKGFAFGCMVSWFVSCNGIMAGEVTDFAMLPALQQRDPEHRTLLDIVKIPLVGNRFRLVAVGEQGDIIYADGQADDWHQASVPVSVTLTAVYFVNEELGWATGHQGIILHTIDGGKTWLKQFSATEAHRQIIEQASSHKAGVEQRIKASTDPLEKEALSNQLEDLDFLIRDSRNAIAAGPSEPLLDIWFADRDFGIAVGAYGWIFTTDDGGKRWKLHPAYFTNVDKYHFYAIEKLDNGDILLCGESGTLWRSQDGAKTWSPVTLPYLGSFFGINVIEPDRAKQGSTWTVNDPDGEVIIVYGLRGHVFSSTDKGKTWVRKTVADEASLMGGDTSGFGDIVLVGASGVIHLSRDRGVSFQTIHLPSKDTLADAVFLDRRSLLLVGKHGLTRWKFDESGR